MPPLEVFQQIYAFSIEMLDLARHDQWDELVLMEEKRAKLLNLADVTLIADDLEREQAALLIKHILECDAESIKLTKSWTHELGGLLNSLANSKRLLHTYNMQ